MRALSERLAAGEVVILDGATGTELQRRGVPMHGRAWSASAIFTHPRVVQQVHEDYVRAGADVIVANTFATNRPLLEGAGLGDRVRELNLAAVGLARRAREAAAGGRPVAVAGSINLWDPPRDEGAARAALEEQAALLAEGGVDLIVLEMMVATGETVLAIEAARAAGLPVWVGASMRRADDGSVVLLRDGAALEAALDAWLPLGAEALLVMHSLPEATGPALGAVRGKWRGPLGAYAHMGEFTMPDWRWTGVLPPERYADEAEGWAALGARILGGCCGTGPDHVAALAGRFRTAR